jgi:iron complex outermembrane receptor protein
VQAIDAQTQLDLCVATLDPLYCDGITRSSVGSINGFNNRLTNLGSIKTDGWDADVFWTLPDTDIGQFKASWQNTFVTRYEAIGAAGQVQPRTVGVEVNDAIPEWTSTPRSTGTTPTGARLTVAHFRAHRAVRRCGGVPGVQRPGCRHQHA